MARACGLSVSTVQRIWRAFGLQPHRAGDVQAVHRSRFRRQGARCGRALPGRRPEHRAMVLCVDEKSQIQALDRSQPVLPMRPGQAGAAQPRLHPPWHDLAVRRAGHRHRPGDRQVLSRAIAPPNSANSSTRSRPMCRDDLDVHLVMDNYATHKTPLIRNWLARRPRWHVHLTPTSASWLNQVERFFALLTERQIRRGIHRSVEALQAAIDALHRPAIMPTPSPSAGPNQPTIFSPRSSASAATMPRPQFDAANFWFRTLGQRPFRLGSSTSRQRPLHHASHGPLPPVCGERPFKTRPETLAPGKIRKRGGAAPGAKSGASQLSGWSG